MHETCLTENSEDVPTAIPQLRLPELILFSFTSITTDVFFFILMKTSCLLPHTCPSLEGTGHDLNAVFTSRTNQTLGCDWCPQLCRDDGVYLTPHVGGSSPVVSRPQASVGTRGQSIILIHLGSQSKIRGALWHYKRLWLKFIPGLFHVQGSVISNQTKHYSLHFPLGVTNVYQS